MNAKFAKVVESLEPTFQRLMGMEPVRAEKLPQAMPTRGIYLFSDGDRHLYVGRTNNLKGRLQNHCRASSNHNTATFAFRVARQETGRTQASYKSSGSRGELEKDPVFGPAFSAAKARIRSMNLRFVEEVDATRQALLEIYAATILETPFNDFENH
ncbi:MAG TPA: GIY-YIG nuclease family protein [Vicinamibacteria bacterium]|nr:GIY-YIG nuclease family protein [Vicinamibacteria bacterium]